MMEQNSNNKTSQYKSRLFKRYVEHIKTTAPIESKPKLKCTCKYENDFSVRYCRGCGQDYRQKEHKEFVKEAYERTVWHEFENIKEDVENLPGIIGFYKKYLDNTLVKLLIILLCLLPAFLIRAKFGSTFRMLESEQYTVQYNETADEYHLFTELDEITVEMYCPGEISSLESHLMDDGGEILETLEYSLEDPVTLKPMETGYVRLEALYADGRVEGMNLYVFQTRK